MRFQEYFMFSRSVAVAGVLALIVEISSGVGIAQTLSPVCQPTVTGPIIVATPAQRLAAGNKAEPPVTDTSNGFAWPDTPMGIIKTSNGYEFFASDGGLHNTQEWQGHQVGNNKYGSVVT